MTSRKKIRASRLNGQKGGVKTRAGKKIVRWNALKHGLLARAIIIDAGDGAEDPKEFSALFRALNTHCKPVGVIEEILVEKIAVSYWRTCRAARIEKGLMQKRLDTFTDDIPKGKGDLVETPTPIENVYRHPKLIESELLYVLERESEIRPCMMPLAKLIRDLELPGKTVTWQNSQIRKFFDSSNEETRKALKKYSRLSKADRLKKMKNFKSSLDETLEKIDAKIVELEAELKKATLLYGNMPLGWESALKEFEVLLRYEVTINNDFYRALNTLNRLQQER